DSLDVSYRTPHGTVRVQWQQTKGKFRLQLTIPKGVPCTVFLPDGTSRSQTTINAKYTCTIQHESKQ
ncbi:MAG: hypothetical protein IJJ26_13245, partial [Victivallales bacterium]|nr:hypothetical protein [Victivallales bacterium]